MKDASICGYLVSILSICVGIYIDIYDLCILFGIKNRLLKYFVRIILEPIAFVVVIID